MHHQQRVRADERTGRALHRINPRGQVNRRSLDVELREMESLFIGAYLTARKQLGLEKLPAVASRGFTVTSALAVGTATSAATAISRQR